MTARVFFDQGLCRRFHGAGLTRPRSAEDEKVANRVAGSGHSCEIRLIETHNFPACFSVPDDALVQVRLKLYTVSRPVFVGTIGTLACLIVLPSLLTHVTS